MVAAWMRGRWRRLAKTETEHHDRPAYIRHAHRLSPNRQLGIRNQYVCGAFVEINAHPIAGLAPGQPVTGLLLVGRPEQIHDLIGESPGSHQFGWIERPRMVSKRRACPVEHDYPAASLVRPASATPPRGVARSESESGLARQHAGIWKDHAGIFRRDVGDGERDEVVIDGRTYRVRTSELT